MKINLSEPFFFGKEYKNVKKTLTRKWISASGKTTKEFEKIKPIFKDKKYFRSY